MFSAVNTYEGQYKSGLKDGYGVFKWPNGRAYQGWWNEAIQYGEGVYTNPKGIRREGMWESKKASWLFKGIVCS